jgi:hypothetical protein
MLSLKSAVICIVSLTVVVIISLIIFEEKFFPSLESCAADDVCVRFCCFDRFSCDGDASFNLNGWPEAKKLRENYRVLKGKPCDEMYQEDDELWAFMDVSI